jgi:hypothetical protein
VLDVPFDEDRARNRRDNGAENLAILRRLTLNRLNKARPGLSLARSATAPLAPTPSQEQSSAECDRHGPIARPALTRAARPAIRPASPREATMDQHIR